MPLTAGSPSLVRVKKILPEFLEKIHRALASFVHEPIRLPPHDRFAARDSTSWHCV